MSPPTLSRLRRLSFLRILVAILRRKIAYFTKMGSSSDEKGNGAPNGVANMMAIEVESHNGTGDNVDAENIAYIRKIKEDLVECIDEIERREKRDGKKEKETRKEDYPGGLTPRRKGPRSELITHPETLPEEETHKNTSQTASQAGEVIATRCVDEFGVWTSKLLATPDRLTTQIAAHDNERYRGVARAMARPSTAFRLLADIEEEIEEDDGDDGGNDDSESTESTSEEETMESYVHNLKGGLSGRSLRDVVGDDFGRLI